MPEATRATPTAISPANWRRIDSLASKAAFISESAARTRSPAFSQVQALTKRYLWFRHVVSDIRMLRIEENNDLMPAIGQGELPLDKRDAA